VSRSPSGIVEAGRVGRAHGLDGSFYVTDPKPRLLRLGTNVTIAGRRLRVTRRAGTDVRPIVRLAEIDDRAKAQALRGQALSVERADAPRLEAQEWWAEELEGCAVVDGEHPVGVVVGLLELPSCEALEVDVDGETVLVPMVRDAIRHVDVTARKVDVDMGFLEAD
jgi:16S rRNA processing protein RimM